MLRPIVFGDCLRDEDAEGGETDDNRESVESDRGSSWLECLNEFDWYSMASVLSTVDGLGKIIAESFFVSTGDIGSITLDGGGDGVLKFHRLP